MIRIYDTGEMTCSGIDGSAIASGSVGPVNGTVLGVYLDYSAGQANTTDVVIATAHAPIATILTVSNTATDGWYYPRTQVCSPAGVALVLNSDDDPISEPLAVRDYISVSVDDGDDTETVRAYIVVRE